MARLATILLLLAATLQAAQPLRVLFIGNSYTFFNNSPEIFADLARTAEPGRTVVTKMVTVPGATLLALFEAHEALAAIRSSKWDYVVLQDQSQLGGALRDGKYVVNSPIMIRWGIRLFDSEIRKAGARTVLLLTWSRREDPDQQADLNYAYDSIARDIGAKLIPVGPAWQKVRQQYPNINLYANDGSHPSPAGSYLSACVLLESLVEHPSARSLPLSVSGHPSPNGVVDNTRNVPLVSLTKEDAAAIQHVARSVVTELRRTGGTLQAPRPDRRTIPPSNARATAPQDIAGNWTGTLTYFPNPASLSMTLQFNGTKCEGQVVIGIPELKQRYEAPAVQCSLSGDRLSFSLYTLPLPVLLDHFEATLVGDRLVGTVDRRGAQPTNGMSGLWTAARPKRN